MFSKCESKISIKKSLLTLSLSLIATWSVDSFAEDSHSNMDHSKMDHSKMNDGGMADKGRRKVLDQKTKKRFVKALEANEELHISFFKYDGKKVETAAKKLNMAMDKITNKELSKLLKFSKTKLAKIVSEKSREENNQNYHLVSMALIHVVKTYDVGSQYNAYSCPMVKKRWIQNSKKIEKVHNPYAATMPHCGSKDTNY
ncbi:hypothetical protein OAQ84_00875 [Bdellovibrionales bacterium]|nr:hypothetical protein [Bdellovibrionales bacterium]